MRLIPVTSEAELATHSTGNLHDVTVYTNTTATSLSWTHDSSRMNSCGSCGATSRAQGCEWRAYDYAKQLIKPRICCGIACRHAFSSLHGSCSGALADVDDSWLCSWISPCEVEESLHATFLTLILECSGHLGRYLFVCLSANISIYLSICGWINESRSLSLYRYLLIYSWFYPPIRCMFV